MQYFKFVCNKMNELEIKKKKEKNNSLYRWMLFSVLVSSYILQICLLD